MKTKKNKPAKCTRCGKKRVLYLGVCNECNTALIERLKNGSHEQDDLGSSINRRMFVGVIDGDIFP